MSGANTSDKNNVGEGGKDEEARWRPEEDDEMRRLANEALRNINMAKVRSISPAHALVETLKHTVPAQSLPLVLRPRGKTAGIIQARIACQTGRTS